MLRLNFFSSVMYLPLQYHLELLYCHKKFSLNIAYRTFYSWLCVSIINTSYLIGLWNRGAHGNPLDSAVINNGLYFYGLYFSIIFFIFSLLVSFAGLRNLAAYDLLLHFTRNFQVNVLQLFTHQFGGCVLGG